MATLTYDPTPADQPEFSEDELDSLAVGEALENQQEQLLAGKYRNAQELEQAYVELQSKLGSGDSDDEEEEENVEEEGEEEELDEEDVFEDEVGITQEDVDTLMTVVGGEENYNEMIEWAAESLSKEEIGMYDYVMDSGDPIAMFFAIKSLSNSYNNAQDSDGELLTGNAPTQTKDVYRSQAEVVAAMSDPRYEQDPAYREDVFQKLERSPIQF